MTPSALRLIIIIVGAGAWELLPRLGYVPPLILSPLSESLGVAVRSYDIYFSNLCITLWEISIGIVIACCGGVMIGGFLGTFPRTRQLLLPLFSSAYAVPFVVLYPLLTVWLGIGSASKIVFASAYGFVPALLTTAAGVQTVEPNLLRAARAMGATRTQLVLKIILPSIVPSILNAARVGTALVVVGVIVGEMLVSTGGIGYLIAQNRTSFNTPEVYLAIMIVLVIAWCLDRAIIILERKFANWSVQARETVR
jgi:NitT/TauT family transport system permease protein/taurine transport system permease protein